MTIGSRAVLPRLKAAGALAVPVLGGIAYLAAFGAPPSHVLVNSGALVLAALWIALAPDVSGIGPHRVIALGCVALLFLPLLTGPSMTGISRWLPLGPFTLHAGMLVVPALVAIAATELDDAPPLLLTALMAAFLQPDAATGLALTFASVGLYHVTREWKIAVVAIIGFFASLIMAMRGELPPQPFVERVFADLIFEAPIAAALLFAMLVAGFFLILHITPATREVRYAIAGSLFGFAIMAIMSHYPTPLVGYGAAPILGFGFALGLGLAKRFAPDPGLS